jgi:glutamate decarboxylase/sulfinoalanine decarboxylase
VRGHPEQQLRDDLDQYLRHAVATLDPTFMNQLFSGLQPWAIAGEMLSVVTNTTIATYEAAPVATLMERELVAHLARFVGWSTHDGIMVTGGSNANLVGLLLARNKLHPQMKKTGMGQERLIAFVSEEAHYSFGKAANVLGLGTDNIRPVATDHEGRLSVAALERAIQESRTRGECPFFVAATAGTTVLGEFDPIAEIARFSREENLWLHVDGAWGGSVLLSRQHRHLMRGIDFADSLGWDTHKMLGTGLVSSFFLTRHADALRFSHGGGGADYIFHASEVGHWDLGPSSLQCGRRTDALKVWFTWRALGDEGLEKWVDTLFAHAQTAAKLIKETPGLELICEPRSLNVCFRVEGPSHITSAQWHRMLREHLMEQGLAMVNMATRKDESFIRLVTCHPRQDEKVLRLFLTQLLEAAKIVSTRPG